MTHKPGPAEADEQAELHVLRDRAAADARQAGDTLAALTGRLTEAARPPALARRAATSLRSQAGQAARRLAQRLAERPVIAARGRIAVAVGLPAGVVAIAVAVVFWRHRRAG
jgi:hypothetical protein